MQPLAQEKAQEFLLKYPAPKTAENLEEITLCVVSSTVYAENSPKGRSDLYLFLMELKKFMVKLSE